MLLVVETLAWNEPRERGQPGGIRSLAATVRELTAKGVEFDGGVTEQRWGLITTMQLHRGSRLGLYEPRHASPLTPAS